MFQTKAPAAEPASLLPASGAGADAAPQQTGAAAQSCPTCGRRDALLIIDGVVYCAACGYASDSARGCT